MLSRTKSKLIIIVFFIIAAVLWYNFTSNSGKKYFILREDLKSISMEVEELKEQNKELEEKINMLKNDKYFLEDVVRREYGFLKSNEVVFDFNKEKKKK